MADDLRIAFIGAGNANFGGGEGPWDHAGRLERMSGLAVVGIADLNADLAGRRLAARRSGAAPGVWTGAKVFTDYRRMLDETRPEAVFVGLPPEAHGLAEAPKDIEVTCADAGVHMFIEKPLSAYSPEQVAPVAEALAAASAKGLVVSVGYMFRYSRAVEQMRRAIAETPGGARAVIARYDCAYSEIASKVWWDLRRTGGAIVEQATHFCDLARFLGGEVDLSTVRGVQIAAGEPAGALCDIPAAPDGRSIDAGIPVAQRIPRATAAVWKFRSGAVGSLTHGVLLHGEKYDSELEVWGDGLRMVLDDPYGRCRLHVRRPGEDRTETLDFAGDDPYRAEAEVFLDAVRSDDASGVRSPYADAFRTYELTWAIRRAGEER